MILTRSPLEPIGMNGAGVNVPKRRSARLSGESVEENEPPAKKNRTEVQAQTSTMSTKEADGDLNAVGKKKRKGMLLRTCWADTRGMESCACIASV